MRVEAVLTLVWSGAEASSEVKQRKGRKLRVFWPPSMDSGEGRRGGLVGKIEPFFLSNKLLFSSSFSK